MKANILEMIKDGLKPTKTYSVFNPKGRTVYSVDPEWVSMLAMNGATELLEKILQLVLDNGQIDKATRNTLNLLRTCIILNDMKRDIYEFKDLLASPEGDSARKRNPDFDEEVNTAIEERKKIIDELAPLHGVDINKMLYTRDTYRKYLNTADEN